MPQTINQSTASGNVGVSSYGGLYENSAGSTITVTTAGTYYGWTTATVGTVAGTGFVTADGNGDTVVVQRVNLAIARIG